MERIGYSRLYATVSGAVLVVLGLAGLLENSQFDFPELTSDLLGFYTVNGWANVFHVAIGLLALLMARTWSRLYTLLAAVIFLGLGFWGLFAADGTLLLSKLPAMRSVNLLNLILGFSALACLLAVHRNRIRAIVSDRVRRRRTRTSRRERRRRRKRTLGSKPKRRSKPSVSSKPGS
ncbi:MAG TPA: DUF4383 domain-containing protein [Solirubrobacterales bacterium]|nr:DUF4383 domain-containing protein [Solirubrobacterales bacterium]